MEPYKKYQKFRAEDFLQDDFFLKWVIGKDTEAAKFFAQWQEDHPDKEATLREARELLENLHRTLEVSDQVNSEVSLDRVHRNIRQHVLRQRRKKVRRISSLVAAVFILFLAFLYWFAPFAEQQPEPALVYRTGFGKTQTVELPDGSRVQLNANSVLSYQPPWNTEQPRRVSLQGEAYFEVKKQPTDMHTTFIVHTSALDVEVLGTEFNVSNRSHGTQVLLSTGKVKVTNNRRKNNHILLQQKGELARVSATEELLQKVKVWEEKYLSWKDNLLNFDRTPMRDIFRLLEDNYGYTVVVEDSSVLAREFVGSYPADEIELLLYSLSRFLELERNEKTLTIRKTRESE